MKLTISFALLLLLLLFSYCKVTNSKFLKSHKALKCINKHQKALIEKLKKQKIIKTKAVERVMCSIDRADFVKEKDVGNAKPQT
jgi:hypothetical protein